MDLVFKQIKKRVMLTLISLIKITIITKANGSMTKSKGKVLCTITTIKGQKAIRLISIIKARG